MSRPNYVTEKHLIFLDELRESGITNMYSARSYILDEFPDLEENVAGDILGYWMKTFSDDTR
jgi:hypothetical protein